MKEFFSRSFFSGCITAILAACSGGQTSNKLPNIPQAIIVSPTQPPSATPTIKPSSTATVVTLTATATPAPTPTATPTPTPTTTPGASLLIPLYENPSTWSALISAKLANPSVPIIAIINPANGPGSTSDSNYVSAIAQLKAAGIVVFGYIHTSYGSESISSLESQISQYAQWYGPSGMFFDEMAFTSGFESYYSTLTQYTKSLGMTTTIGNPGADSIPSYIGTVDTIVIYESSGYPTLSFLSGGWHASYAKSNFAFIAYGVSSLNVTLEQSEAAYVKYEYVTDQSTPDPYNALPSYLSTELSAF